LDSIEQAVAQVNFGQKQQQQHHQGEKNRLLCSDSENGQDFFSGAERKRFSL